jgi:hypothetical protein
MGSAEVPGGDGITSAGFVPDNDRNGYALAGDLPANMTGGYWTVEALVRVAVLPSGSTVTIVRLVDGAPNFLYSTPGITVGLNGGGVPFASINGTTATASSGALAVGRWTHLAAFCWTSPERIEIYVDGVSRGSTTLGSGYAQLDRPSRIYVGGTNKPDGGGYHQAFCGNVANVAVTSTLTAARLAVHGQSSSGFAGDSAVARFQRVCRVAGLAAADYATTSTSLTVPPGNSAPAMGEQPTDGRPFLDAVQECADVERGVAYMDGAGVLTLQRGAFRFNQAVALTLAPKDVDSSTSIDDDLDRLVNDVTVRRPGGAEQRVVNQASVDAYDTHNETLEIAAADDGQALAVAAWKVADEGTPQPRVDSVAVDAVAKASTVAASSLLTVPQSGRVQLTPMPTPACSNRLLASSTDRSRTGLDLTAPRTTQRVVGHGGEVAGGVYPERGQHGWTTDGGQRGLGRRRSTPRRDNLLFSTCDTCRRRKGRHVLRPVTFDAETAIDTRRRPCQPITATTAALRSRSVRRERHRLPGARHQKTALDVTRTRPGDVAAWRTG